MYIHSKPVAAFYKLAIGALSLFLEWYILSQYGWTAFRFFSTWVLFLSAIYFLSSALYLAVSHERESGKNPCPMFEGMIITAFFLISSTVIAAQTNHFALPELATWLRILIAGVLPTLTFLDWVLFVKKGRFQIMDPFYWLALPTCYAATMIFTAELLPITASYRYPLEMFNYQDFGLLEMFLVMLLVAIIYLAVGYAWFVIDFALSGKLAKKIVMLHIRTVEVKDEDAQDSSPEIENEATTEDDILEPQIGTEAKDDILESQINTAADEALEELKEFTETADDDLPTEQDVSVDQKDEENNEEEKKEKVEIETIDIVTSSAKSREHKTSKTPQLEYEEKVRKIDNDFKNQEKTSKTNNNPTSQNKTPKTGKAMDIEVIRARVNGNKKSTYSNSKRNNSNNLHNSRKKKSKKRR